MSWLVKQRAFLHKLPQYRDVPPSSFSSDWSQSFQQRPRLGILTLWGSCICWCDGYWEQITNTPYSARMLLAWLLLQHGQKRALMERLQLRHTQVRSLRSLDLRLTSVVTPPEQRTYLPGSLVLLRGLGALPMQAWISLNHPSFGRIQKGHGWRVPSFNGTLSGSTDKCEDVKTFYLLTASLHLNRWNRYIYQC